MHILEHFKTEVKAKSFIRRFVFKHSKDWCSNCRIRKRMTVLGDGRYWCKYCRTKHSLKQLASIPNSKLNIKTIGKLLYCFLNNHTLQATIYKRKTTRIPGRIPIQIFVQIYRQNFSRVCQISYFACSKWLILLYG